MRINPGLRPTCRLARVAPWSSFASLTSHLFDSGGELIVPQRLILIEREADFVNSRLIETGAK